MKFAFLASADEITDANAIINAKDATTVETSAYYQDFTTMQSAEFDGLTAPEMDQNIYFVCYLEDVFGEQVAVSTVRSINPYDMVLDASNGYLFDTDGAEGVKIPNEKEVALYQKIVAYCDAYDAYDALATSEN